MTVIAIFISDESLIGGNSANTTTTLGRYEAGRCYPSPMRNVCDRHSFRPIVLEGVHIIT